jgi:hypothetical protein
MKLVMIPVREGTGCAPRYYAVVDSHDCAYPSHDRFVRQCSVLVRTASRRVQFLTLKQIG